MEDEVRIYRPTWLIVTPLFQNQRSSLEEEEMLMSSMDFIYLDEINRLVDRCLISHLK